MKTYIGTKIIQAEPAFRIDGKIYSPDNILPKDTDVEEGYRVRYSDGYESWSPKGVFEQAYLPVTVNPDLRTDSPSISQQMVDDFILKTWTQTMGDKTTVVRALLRNGFEIVESSACVSAENYDEKLGREICLGKIKDKVWFLLGFLLQTAVHGAVSYTHLDVYKRQRPRCSSWRRRRSGSCNTPIPKTWTRSCWWKHRMTRCTPCT